MSSVYALRRLGPRPSLQQLFERNEGRLTHKWTHYFAIYERHFAPFRFRAPQILEIGVSHGGSLDLWRSWFGRGTQIVGIDIDPRVVQLVEPGIDICVGDQSDPEFLRDVMAKYGPFDIVIDDGSHLPAHQRASLDTLWSSVKLGGVYLVEDLHTNYWSEYGSGLGQPDTFIEFTKTLVDDLHAYHSRERGFNPSHWTRSLGALHVYDSIVVLDRADQAEPIHAMTGRPVFDTVYGEAVEESFNQDEWARIETMNRPHRRLLYAARTPVRSSRRFLKRRR